MSRAFSNHRSTLALAITLAATFAVSTGVAQSPDNYTSPPGPFHQPVSPYPIEFGFTRRRASTAAEGFLRGKADVIQALGNFQLSQSQADILRQQARGLDRENDLKQTEALLAQKKMWSDARSGAQNVRKAKLAEGRQILAERQATVYRQAYRLSAAELDVTTGAISWPAVLQSEEYQQHRAQLEQLFQQHFGYGDPQAATAEEISHAVERWSRSLQSDRGSLPRDEYLAAQKFLYGLKYTAATPLQNVANSRTIAPQPLAGATLANQ